MSPSRRSVLAALLVAVVCVPAVRADEGMWLPNRLPLEHLKKTYGFVPDAAWVEHIQKSCVRFNVGGSGSLISSDGLVMTNHHVGSDHIEKLSTAERNLMRDGFVARTRDEELRCDDLELNVLWNIEDVTDRVNTGIDDDTAPSAAREIRNAHIAEIEKESQDATGLKAQVVSLFHGARYHLYTYKRYTDIRLVMCPEQSVAFFGGDNDNFEYPRYCLDVCFFRIYENGKPLKPEHHLDWNTQGIKEGDLTFVVGHPARTQRLLTVDHLRFMRDHYYPQLLRSLWRREVKLLGFSGRSAENQRIANGDLLGAQNGRKAITGIVSGLNDPSVFKAKQIAEEILRGKVNANPEYKAQWGSAWDQVASASKVYAEILPTYLAVERRGGFQSDLYSIARHLVRAVNERVKPDSERLPEYTEAALESLKLQLFSPAPIYDALEVDRLESGFLSVCETFGGESELAKTVLGNKSPLARAEELVHGTKLRDVAVRRLLFEGGTQAIASSNDPMIVLARTVDPVARQIRKRFDDEVDGVFSIAYARIAAAQFAIGGEGIPPDATFSLRFSFGPVRGYTEGTTQIPAFTKMSGTFDRMAERGGEAPFVLPQRWIDGKSKLNGDTPYDFVCTADIIGGNSGSPTIDKDGRVVGIVFDGNLHALVWDIAYTDKQARAVNVDARAIIEALSKLYQAYALVAEITRN